MSILLAIYFAEKKPCDEKETVFVLDISVAIFGKGTVMLCRHQCGHLWEGYSDVVQTSV